MLLMYIHAENKFYKAAISLQCLFIQSIEHPLQLCCLWSFSPFKEMGSTSQSWGNVSRRHHSTAAIIDPAGAAPGCRLSREQLVFHGGDGWIVHCGGGGGNPLKNHVCLSSKKLLQLFLPLHNDLYYEILLNISSSMLLTETDLCHHERLQTPFYPAYQCWCNCLQLTLR